MRTRQQIEDRLDQMMEHLNQSPRLTESEKDLTSTLLSQLKDEFARDRENFESEIELLSTTEVYNQFESKSGNVIQFKPRNDF